MRSARSVRALTALVVTLTLRAPARADKPTNEEVALWGAAMAVPGYLLGVATHEGAHALVAHAFGAEVTDIHLYPEFEDGRLYFGRIFWHGDLSRDESALMLLAPKVADVGFLATYAALLGLEAMPSRKSSALALTVYATVCWVDFSLDLFSSSNSSDMVLVYDRYDLSPWEQVPFRVVHAGLSAVSAYILYRGYVRIFDGRW